MSDLSKEHLQQIGRSIRDLLADEARASETMDPAQKERILQRLERALGLPPDGGPGGGIVDGGVATASATSISTRSRFAKKSVLPVAALAVAAALVFRVDWSPTPQSAVIRPDEALGTVPRAPTQAVLHVGASTDLPTPTLAVEALPTTEATTEASAMAASAPKRILPNTIVAETPSPKRAPAPEAVSSAHASPGLAEERALVASLRVALVARRFDEAARLLREHEAVFPEGQLVAEREVLRVWLLEDTGQKEAASARASQFHESYPNSVLRSAVDRRAN